MKKYIIKKKQLNGYIERKKSEKTFYDILEKLYMNKKMLNESFSEKKVNQTIIDDFKRRGLINPIVKETLIKNEIIDINYKII